MTSPMPVFAVSTLLPLPLIAAAALFGGIWVLLALAYVTVMSAALDALVAWTLPTAPDRSEFPAADALSAVLAVAHLALMALTVRALAGPDLGAPEKAGLFLAMGIFAGQVGNSNAHELIHRPGRLLRRLGMWVYISHYFGHHTSAHPLVHHVHVATARDPNSPRRGESYYRFAPRAWIGSFRAGLRAETARRRRAGKPGWSHPYVTYAGGALLVLAVAGALGGPAGMLWSVALGSFATSQLLMSDYVQHYGLARTLRPDGRVEPVSMRHSWNAPHWFTQGLMLNAPRHSDHHTHPARPYPALTLPPDAPLLPHSLPVMACLALAPRHWRRVMDPLAARWRAAPTLAAE